MLYAVLCYNDENAVASWTKEEDEACMARLAEVNNRMAARGKLGPVARLEDTGRAVTVRKGAKPFVVDGPFAETKEQFLGIYLVDCETLDEAVAFVEELTEANPGSGSYEIRPVRMFEQGAFAAKGKAEAAA